MTWNSQCVYTCPHQITDQSVAREDRMTYGGRVPVGVVDTCVVTLVDPLPEDGAGNGLVGQQQAYHLVKNHPSKWLRLKRGKSYLTTTCKMILV